MSARSGQFVITIEGVGTSSTDGDGLYHFAQGASALFGYDAGSDPDGLYQEALLGYPQALEQRVDFVGGAVQSGSLAFDLAATPVVLQELYQSADAPVANLLSTITLTTTTVILDVAGLDGQVIHAGREAILLGSGGGTGLYTGCTRGHLGTTPQAVAILEGADPRVFARPSARSLQGRVVRWYFAPAGLDPFTDLELVWSGALYGVSQPTVGQVRLQVDDALQRLASAYLFRDPWVLTSGTPGGRPARRPAAGYSGAQDLVLYLEGEGVFVAGWRQDADGRYDLAPSSLGAARVEFAGQPIPEDFPYPGTFREIVSTHADQPASSASPSTNTLPLSQDAGELLLQLLTTTPAGGNHPPSGTDYDLGIANLSGATPYDLVDYDQILAWSQQFATWPVDNLHLGVDGPQPVLSTAQNLLRPFGASLAVGADGRLRVAQLRDTVDYGAGVVEITQEDVLPGSITTDRRLQDTLERVSVAYAHVPGADPSIEEARVFDQDASNPLVPIGQGARVEFDAPFLDRGPAQASGARLAARFAQPPLSIHLAVHREIAVGVGDVVLIEHTLIPGTSGARGVTAAQCLVVGRQERVEQDGHAIELDLLYVGAAYTNQGYYAPAARIVSWDAGTSTATVQANAFASASAGPHSTDAAAFPKGAPVKICDQYYTDRETGLTVDLTPSGNTITLSAPSVTPVAGDLILLDAWTGSYAGQYAAIADDAGELDGDAANAYQWVTG